MLKWHQQLQHAPQVFSPPSWSTFIDDVKFYRFFFTESIITLHNAEPFHPNTGRCLSTQAIPTFPQLRYVRGGAHGLHTAGVHQWILINSEDQRVVNASKMQLPTRFQIPQLNMNNASASLTPFPANSNSKDKKDTSLSAIWPSISWCHIKRDAKQFIHYTPYVGK